MNDRLLKKLILKEIHSVLKEEDSGKEETRTALDGRQGGGHGPEKH